MRSLALALLALALTASPASAAVIEFEDRSSPEENERTFAIVVRAAPGEANVIAVRTSPGGIAIEDAGAPLTGACQPSGAGRFCAGSFAGVDVHLGDGDDRLEHDGGGDVDGGAGDDEIRVASGFFNLIGGPGADRLDATAAAGASVSYADHAAGVAVRLNGLPDDGALAEGDNVLGQVTGIIGGSGDDRLEAGPVASGLSGMDGADTLVGSPERDTLHGGNGDDELHGEGGTDYLVGDPGADVLSGGADVDEVSYGGSAPLRLSIGDGANDGAAGEGDDIREDVEWLSGGFGDDLLIGDEDANRLIGHGGRDVLRGQGGADELIGWGDGDELDAGAGRDRVATRFRARGLDRALLADGEADTLDCDRGALFLEADGVDRLRECAPAVVARRRGPLRRGRRVALSLRCPLRSAVPCRGRAWIETRTRRRLSGVARFGPMRPGHRRSLRLLVRGRPRGCVYAAAVTRRTDGLDSRTVTRTLLRCRPG
jgi:Ca2+-binding RTX toxin-like protein